MDDCETKEVETTQMETVRIPPPHFQFNDYLITSEQGVKII